MPRFVVINKLGLNFKLLQMKDFAGVRREVSISSGCVRPFHLPDVDDERKLAIQVEGDICEIIIVVFSRLVISCFSFK
jgi:hypothetical protein